MREHHRVISPIWSTHQAATGQERTDSTPDLKKKRPACASDRSKRPPALPCQDALIASGLIIASRSRRPQDVGQRQQRDRRRHRFVMQHVEGRGGEVPAAQRRLQRSLIHQRAARRVDQDSTWSHRGEEGGIHHAARLRVGRAVQGYDIGGRQALRAVVHHLVAGGSDRACSSAATGP
jgi:hypothetical protein